MRIIFRNGLWRSVWSIKFTPGQGKAELQGKIKAQVHYYENGNVQLVSYKDVNQSISFSVGFRCRMDTIVVFQFKSFFF